jgi:hypothetical protein
MSEEHVFEPSNVDGISPEQFKLMGSYLMQGMNESEAAVLAGIDRMKLMVARRSSQAYNNFVEKKKLEFKSKHLQVLSSKPDPKTSQWLLERLSPQEFSSKGSRSEVPQNAVESIIKAIQEGGAETSGLKFAYKDIYDQGRSSTQGPSGDEAEQKIRAILS